MLEGMGNLLHCIDVHAAFMRKRRGAHPWLTRIVPQIGDLIHEVRKVPQVAQ